jgi:hypothetical protein
LKIPQVSDRQTVEGRESAGHTLAVSESRL